MEGVEFIVMVWMRRVLATIGFVRIGICVEPWLVLDGDGNGVDVWEVDWEGHCEGLQLRLDLFYIEDV